MSIELEVPGDPAAVRSAATQVDDVVDDLEDLAATLTRCRSRAHDGWLGPAYANFAFSMSARVSAIDELSGSCSDVSSALSSFASALARVKSDLGDARAIALAGGCTVSGQVIRRPDDLEGEASQDVVAAHDRKVVAYDRALAKARAARDDERAAHETLQSALDAATGPGLVEGFLQDFGLLPKGEGVAWDVTAAVTTFGLGAGSGLTWATMHRYGRYQPTWGPFSRTGIPRNHMAASLWERDPAWRRAIRSSRPGNFTARPGMSSTRAFYRTTGDVLSKGGAVLEGGVGAYQQWQADADNPALNGSERVARSATVGTTTGLGAYGGALAGAQVGAAIGSFVPGPGTAIGGIVGGAIGGFVGSKAGEAVGDFVKDEVGAAAHWAQDSAVAGWDATSDAAGEAWDATSDAAGEAWDTAGDVADDVGDVASDVGDKLSFWD